MLPNVRQIKKQHFAWEGEGEVCDGHYFLRASVPSYQGGFPKAVASPWLLKMCKLHRSSRGARDDNALESHLFVCKIISSSALSTCLPPTTSHACCFGMLHAGTIHSKAYSIELFYFSWLMLYHLEVISKQWLRRKDRINVSFEPCKLTNVLTEGQGPSGNIQNILHVSSKDQERSIQRIANPMPLCCLVSFSLYRLHEALLLQLNATDELMLEHA